MIDEEARAETAALRAEFAKWCDEHSPEAYGREGWRQRRENNPQESEADRRRGEARERVLRAPSSVRNLPHPKIFKWLVGRWPSCPGRTTGISRGASRRAIPSSRMDR